MYFSKYFLMICTVFSVLSCSKDNSIIDPKLAGTWSDGNVNYSFANDKTFGIKYTRSGTTNNPVTTDSIWGNYTVDSRRKNIYFEANFKTLTQNMDSVIAQRINLPVWNYNFTSDTTMTYKSSSADAKLKKIK